LNAARSCGYGSRFLFPSLGEDAATQAAMRADEFDAENNFGGQQHWILIMKAIEVLQRTRAPGEAVN
jgi:hypothetical protein